MREVLKNTKSVLLLSILFLFLFSSCDNLNFGKSLRDQVEDDLGVTYSFYEEPDIKATRVNKKFITGKRITNKDFPKFERENDMVAGWLYLKNYNKPESKLPSNFITNRKNYISEVTVTNSSESFYAVWKKKCEVKFVTNCDINLAPLTTPQGEFIEWPEIERKHNGLLLWGWYKDPDFKEPFGYDEIVIDDITLYAQWVEYRTVTYYKNDGSKEKAEIDYRLNDESVISDCMFGERKGYGFVGWSTTKNASDNSAVNYNNGDPIKVTENLDLYAVWSTDIVTITYVDTSGTFATRTTKYGRNAYITVGRVLDENGNWFRYLHDIWKLDGKELAGFSTTPGAVAPYEFNGMGYYGNGNAGSYNSNAYQVTGDTTFYGHIDDIEYTVYFYVLTKSGNYELKTDMTQIIKWNKCAVLPADPAIVPGHTFKFWCQGFGGENNPVLYSSPFDFSTVFNDDTMNGMRTIYIYSNYAEGGNNNGTISGTITFTELGLSDLVVTTTTSPQYFTVTINTSDVKTDTIRWNFDTADKSEWNGQSSHQFDRSTLSKGYHDLVITAQKTDGYYYSYQAQLEVK